MILPICETMSTSIIGGLSIGGDFHTLGSDLAIPFINACKAQKARPPFVVPALRVKRTTEALAQPSNGLNPPGTSRSSGYPVRWSHEQLRGNQLINMMRAPALGWLL